MSALSIVDVMFTLGVAATVGGAALSPATAALDAMRAAGAVRFVAARLAEAKVRAVKQSRDIAVAFTAVDATFMFTTYGDGNRNGIRSRDIQAGIDSMIQSPQALRDHFRGVEFASATDLPAVDASSTPPGTDPIHVGAANMVVFTPTGTATAGSIYLRSRGGVQYVVRIFGETGKIRILKFNARSRTWNPL